MTSDPVCRAFGRQHITPAAGAAARAVFLSCGGAPGWSHWTTPRGEHVRVVLAAFAAEIDARPDAPAEALYMLALGLGWHGDAPAPWVELPASVRAAYNAFRAIYLEMSAQVDEAERAQERSAPGRDPGGSTGMDRRVKPGGDVDGDCEVVLISRDPSRRRPRSEGARVAATVHDVRQAMKRRDKQR